MKVLTYASVRLFCTGAAEKAKDPGSSTAFPSSSSSGVGLELGLPPQLFASLPMESKLVLVQVNCALTQRFGTWFVIEFLIWSNLYVSCRSDICGYCRHQHRSLLDSRTLHPLPLARIAATTPITVTCREQSASHRTRFTLALRNTIRRDAEERVCWTPRCT